MADLKTNYVDDVLDTTKNQLRKYQQIQNDDGTVSFVDVTEYTQLGTSFGAKDINDTNAAINDVNGKLRNECLTYNKGDECAVLSGGWGTYTSGGTVTKNDNCMVIYVGNNQSYRANAYTNNYIDLTNYNKLIITADTLVTGYKAIQLINPSGTITELKSVYGNASYSKDNPIELNISNYNGEYRIQFYAAAYNGADKFTIYSVELV